MANVGLYEYTVYANTVICICLLKSTHYIQSRAAFGPRGTRRLERPRDPVFVNGRGVNKSENKSSQQDQEEKQKTKHKRNSPMISFMATGTLQSDRVGVLSIFEDLLCKSWLDFVQEAKAWLYFVQVVFLTASFLSSCSLCLRCRRRRVCCSCCQRLPFPFKRASKLYLVQKLPVPKDAGPRDMYLHSAEVSGLSVLRRRLGLLWLRPKGRLHRLSDVHV